MVEEPLPRREDRGDGGHLRVARAAVGVVLLHGELPGDDELHLLERFPLRGLPGHPHVLAPGVVARLAVDPRLRPGGAVAVRRQVVVDGDLAHVAAVARGVEGVERVRPREGRRVVGKGAEVAGGGQEPLLLPHVVGDGEDLQASLLQGGEEVEHILAAHGVVDPVFPLPAGTALDHPPRLAADVGPISQLPCREIPRRLRELLLRELRGERLHRQPVEGGGPELVEPLVALPAPLGAGHAGRGGLGEGGVVPGGGPRRGLRERDAGSEKSRKEECGQKGGFPDPGWFPSQFDTSQQYDSMDTAVSGNSSRMCLSEVTNGISRCRASAMNSQSYFSR